MILSFFLVWGGVNAQNCGYFPFPTAETYPIDTDPCANYIIRTDPYNPYNRQYLPKYNVFNWIDPNPDAGTVFDEYCLNSTESNATHVKTPWSQDDNLTIAHFFESGDRYPKDGWELIKYDLGYAPSGQPTGVKVDFPYLILYNRFTGILRVFYADNPQNAAYNVASIGIKFRGDTYASSNLDISTAFTSTSDGLGALKNFIPDAEFRAAARFVNGNMRWTYAEFPMMYDPCVCYYETMELVVEIRVSENYEVIGTLTTNGSIQPSGNGSGPILSSTSGTYNDQNGQSTFGWKDISGVNDAFQKAAKGYKDVSEFVKGGYLATDNSGYSSDEIASKKEAISDLADALKLKDFLKAGLKAVPYVSAAITFLDYFVAGGKKESASGPIKLHPMGIEMNSRFQGNIQRTLNRKDILFYVPGSAKFLNMTANESEKYPYYNQALGVFNLVETPTIKYNSTYVGSPSFWPTTYGPVYVVDKNIDPTWESWDNYLPHSHPEFDPNSFYAVDPFNHQPFGDNQDDPVRNYVYKIDSDVAYLVNPATEFSEIGSEVLAAIWIEVRNGSAPSGVGFLQNTNFNLFSEGKGIYRTEYVPLSCINGLTAEFSTSDYNIVNVYLKVIANFARGDIYAFEGLDPDELTNNVQNVLWSGKFRLEKTQDTNLGIGDSNPFVNVPEEVVFYQNTNLTQDVVAYEKIIVSAGVQLTASVPVTLRSGKSIIFQSGSSYSPNITLQVAQPNGCTDYYNPTPKDALASFCVSELYRENRMVENRSGRSDGDDPISGENSFNDTQPLKASPNPFTHELTLEFTLPTAGITSARLLDPLGREVMILWNGREREAGPQSETIDLSALSAGIYLAVLETPQGRQTVRVVKE